MKRRSTTARGLTLMSTTFLDDKSEVSTESPLQGIAGRDGMLSTTRANDCPSR
jgi:hypothetical protein